MAFADDLALLADSAIGLQHLIDYTTAFLHECGIALNDDRPHTVAIFGHRGKTIAALRRYYAHLPFE